MLKYYNNPYKPLLTEKLMQITTEADMLDFCAEVSGKKAPFKIMMTPVCDYKEVADWQIKNWEMIRDGYLNQGSHLQSGIRNIELGPCGAVRIEEEPRLYPSPQVVKANKDLTGTTWGVLVDAYDPKNRKFLWQLRGKDLSAPWAIQAAAAGMSCFGEHPYNVAIGHELREESGILDEVATVGNKAIGIFPFMKKAGEFSFPQPLFSFGFLYQSDAFLTSFYPTLSDLEKLVKYEEWVKEMVATGTLLQREAYHFHVPLTSSDSMLKDILSLDPLQTGKNGGFYGPIAECHRNFTEFLKSQGYLN